MSILKGGTFHYIAFGNRILSKIKLPELLPHHGTEYQEDIIIKIEDLKQVWNKKAEQGQFFFIDGNRILFRVPETGIFLIEEGRKIVVSADEQADEGLIRLFILGTCMGAILLQRRFFPLHGSAISINGKAYAFVGDSGVGKSTLASTFINRGYKILSDDLIAVSFNNDELPYVTPA